MPKKSLSKPTKLKKPAIEDGRIDVHDKKLVAFSQLSSLYSPKQLATVTILIATECALTSMEGIQAFPNLVVIRLMDNRIVETDGLERLEKLERLFINNNRISKLPAIPNLKVLDCCNNRITSLDDLHLPASLEVLQIDDNKVSSMEPVRRLTKLRELTMSSNAMTRVCALESLPALTRFTVHLNPVAEIAAESAAAIRQGRRARRLEALLGDAEAKLA